MQQVLPYGEEAILVHCTTLHAGLLSAVAQQAGGGQVVGACPHRRAGCDGRRGWGTPAGRPQSAQGEEVVRRWQCQVGTAPAGAELGFGVLTAAVTQGECSRAGPGTVSAVLQSPARFAAAV